MAPRSARGAALTIGIDYTAAVRQRAGIGRYTRNLIRSLVTLDDRNRYALYVAGGWGKGDGLGPWPRTVRLCPVPVPDRWMHIMWQRWRVPLPVQTFTGPLSLFHSPDFVLPPVGRVPAVVTVHDLSFLRVPECFVPRFRQYLEKAVARAVVRAAKIVADSHSTKRDLVELMQVPADRIDVLYPGVEPRFRRVRDPEELSRVRERYRLPLRFVLALATVQPRKNLDGLVDIFAQLVSCEDAEVNDLSLVLAGEEGWLVEKTRDAVRRTGLADRVRFTGYVDEADLPGLYSLASVFAFPSWYEGFGLPVLEAMACGTPVVVADNSSLPEVVGGAGLLVNAADRQGWVEAISRVLRSEELRARMEIAGKEQSHRFTWEGAAERLLEVYESLLGTVSPALA